LVARQAHAAIQVFAQEFDALFQTVKSKAEMPMDVWDKAADIYIALKQKGQLIKDADILIAAYCMVNDYTLVTRNKDDFKRIDGLVFVDWFE
jgi:predicted nucleic acid-binding protein